MSLEVTFRHPRGEDGMDVAFRSEGAGVTALFGPSGSGKTTTIDVIAGLLRPERGRVVVGERVLLDTNAGIDLPAHRRRIGYVFQDARLFPHLSVDANLRFGWRRTRPRPPEATVHALVDVLALGPLLARRPTGLSGGERRRVALGRALAMAPAVLLLDEPLAGLDAARRAEIVPWIERARDVARIPIVYVSHELTEVARLADRVVVLDRGRVTTAGSVFDVTALLDVTGLDPAFEVGAVLDATVVSHDAADRLSELDVPGGRIVVPAVARAIGETVRIRIAARDVTLALSAPADSSANNVLAGVVDAIQPSAGAHADVLVRIGTWRLPARVTHRSIRRLRLTPGRAVYAVVKAITVDRGSPSGSDRPAPASA